MHTTLWQRTLAASSIALLLAAPAQAVVANFDDVSPGIYAPMDTYVRGAYTFTLASGVGVVDTSAAFGAGTGLDLAGPKGNLSQYFVALNDAKLQLRATDNSVFWVLGVDYGFVSALTRLFMPGENPGQFQASFVTSSGSTGMASWSFGNADAQGEFSFISLGQADLAPLSGGIRQVEFSACTYDVSLACVTQNGNFSQFAMDNISVSSVPEPTTWLLMGLGLGLVASRRRRLCN